MTYKYRVTLTGIKGFFRVYKISGENSLYTFHKQMRADMEFPQDQLILFKGLDAEGAVVARYGLFDLGSGAADQVTISQTLALGITSFVYFYDVTNRKSVNVTFEGEFEGEHTTMPVLVESKGPDPISFENGYVAFEDLPDEQRHLPGEGSETRRKSKLEEILGISVDDVDEDSGEDEDPDDEEKDIEEEEEAVDEDDFRNDGVEIYDGTEELPV